MTTLVVLVVAMALLFDFLNGMNDAANSIATVVSTRVLSPLQAVAWAAFFNFIAAFGFGTHVANAIAKIVDADIVTVPMVLAALGGAILWTHVCTRAGLPISVSHALIGGVVGAALAKEGWGPGYAALNHAKLKQVAVWIVASPVAGLLGAYFLMVGVTWAFRNATRRRVGKVFKVGQLFSSAAFALSHGLSDAQKTMGIMVLALVAGGLLPRDLKEVPRWVILSAHGAIALGTLAGGWKVIHTMGTKLTKLHPEGGFCAETAGAAVCIAVSQAGVPISTTHTITGSIMGVGGARRVGAVRWNVAGRILWAWVLTIPCSALAGAATWWLLSKASSAAS